MPGCGFVGEAAGRSLMVLSKLREGEEARRAAREWIEVDFFLSLAVFAIVSGFVNVKCLRLLWVRCSKSKWFYLSNQE